MTTKAVLKTVKEQEQAERAGRDFYSVTLAPMENPFARLVYLASMRDFTVDEYIHWGMENVYGEAATNAALARLHRDAFREVSALPLAELIRQVRQYLARHEDGGRILLHNWRTGLVGVFFLPPGLDPLEAENFRINITAALACLNGEEPPSGPTTPPPPAR